MQPKPSSSRAGAAKPKLKLLDIRTEKSRIRERRENAREVGTNNKITCVEVFFQRTIDKYSACVEVGKPIDENSACVEVGTTHKHLRRGDKSNNFKNYFSSNDITCEEVKSVDSQRFSSLDTSYVRATREPEKKKKDSPLVSMEIPLRTAYGQNGRCGMQPKPQSSRAGAANQKTKNFWTLEQKEQN
ncbi:hypothetical protein TNCV_4856751 [Trichonephila clavipes]|nr:hypothetical protein TNCV_4856751 [Trichonephila clavipes]